MKRKPYNQTAVQLFENAQNVLKTKQYASASDLAVACGVSVQYIYQVIRKMREKKIPIMNGRYGYVLANEATVQDDVHFMRRLNGRRVSDIVALDSCIKHIKPRWSPGKERQLLLGVTSPLLGNQTQLIKNNKLLGSFENPETNGANGGNGTNGKAHKHS